MRKETRNRWFDLFSYFYLSTVAFLFFSFELSKWFYFLTERWLKLGTNLTAFCLFSTILSLSAFLISSRPRFTLKSFFAYPPIELPISAGFIYLIVENGYLDFKATLLYVIFFHFAVESGKQLQSEKKEEDKREKALNLLQWIDSDEAIDSVEFDKFDHKPIVKQLKEGLLSQSSSLGLFGSFGAGKSTIIKMVKSEILKEKPDKFIFCSVDTWGLKKEGLVENVLNRVVSRMSSVVDCSSLRSLPEQYIKAISIGGFSWLDRLSVFSPQASSPEEIVSKFDGLLEILDLKLILDFEDIDREVSNRTEWSDFAGLLDRIRATKNIKYIVSIDPTLVNKELPLDRLVELVVIVPKLASDKCIELVFDVVESFSEEIDSNEIRIPTKRIINFGNSKGLTFYSRLPKENELIEFGKKWYDSDEAYPTEEMQRAFPYNVFTEIFTLFIKEPRSLKKVLRKFKLYYSVMPGEIETLHLFFLVFLLELCPSFFFFISTAFDCLETLLPAYLDKENEFGNFKNSYFQSRYFKEILLLEKSFSEFEEREREALVRITSELLVKRQIRLPLKLFRNELKLSWLDLENFIEFSSGSYCSPSNIVFEKIYKWKFENEKSFPKIVLEDPIFLSGFLNNQPILETKDWDKLIVEVAHLFSKKKVKKDQSSIAAWIRLSKIYNERPRWLNEEVSQVVISLLLKIDLELCMNYLKSIDSFYNKTLLRELFKQVKHEYEAKEWSLEESLPGGKPETLFDFISYFAANGCIQNGSDLSFLKDKILNELEISGEKLACALLNFSAKETDVLDGWQKYTTLNFIFGGSLSNVIKKIINTELVDSYKKYGFDYQLEETMLREKQKMELAETILAQQAKR